MPKLSQFRENEYYYFSGKASEQSRNLALAGLALIWILKTNKTGISIDKNLILPLILFIATLAFDLLQYLWGTMIWGFFVYTQEKKLKNVATEDPDVEAPAWYNRPTNLFFYLKIASVIAGFILLFIKLVKIII